ncbi:MAG TPA: FAD-dependent oxidoreductase, partial [Longimicrobium sp.]|nr:FAD-dependent oxidoreductase [Longimicrobium sp.]
MTAGTPLRTRRSPRLAALLLSVLAALAGTAREAAAVSVSPTALYIDSRTRTGILTLYNPGSLPEEVTLDFAYGFPQADSAGNVSVPLTREPAAGEPSALGWMRAFPRRLLLQPGQRQVVRVMVEPPADLPDGEYWARLVISSRGGQPPIEQTQGEVRLQLNVTTSLVIAANYRKGDVRTGVRLATAEARRDGGDVVLELGDGEELRGDRLLVATGSEAVVPPVPGLRELDGVWTNREATGLREIPRRLLVLGGGAVGL